MMRAIRRDTMVMAVLGASQWGCSSHNQTEAPALAPAAAPSEPSAEPSPVAESDSAADASDADIMAQIAEQERLADAQAHPEEAPTGEYVPREVVYRVSPDGLKIQVDGAEFRPKAEAIKIKGGYGVVISVEASSNAPLTLLNPNGGPLAFGGYVRRPDKETISDTRKGEDEIPLAPGAAQTFKRTWPSAGHSPLFYGQKLELQVGLWGLGPSSDERRPVLKFFAVRMRVDDSGAHPIVEPPH